MTVPLAQDRQPPRTSRDRTRSRPGRPANPFDGRRHGLKHPTTDV